MESFLSFTALSFGRDQESAPPSEAEAYQGQLEERDKNDVWRHTWTI